jgi:branched-subunit amino acid transport protein
VTELLIAIVVAGVLTFLTRLSFIGFLADREAPALVARALHFVPPAVLTAIVFPELLIHDGGINASPGNLRLLAGMIAIAVAWRYKRILLTIVVGMATLWALQAFS